MKVVIFGASGLVGNELLKLCLADNKIREVRIFSRKKLNINSTKLIQYITDFISLEDVKIKIYGDVVFNCLGTTIRKAGSQNSQYEIDCSYPIAVAKYAKDNGTRKMISVSSVGVSPNGNFYLKTKHDMEMGIQSYFGNESYIMRPSFLSGDRQELRMGEKIGIALFSLINPFLFGKLTKYKIIRASDVAKAMLYTAKNDVTEPIAYYSEMIDRARKIG